MTPIKSLRTCFMVLIDLIKLSPLNSSQSVSFLAPFELPRQKMPQQLSSGSAVPSPFSSRLATKVTRVRSVQSVQSVSQFPRPFRVARPKGHNSSVSQSVSQFSQFPRPFRVAPPKGHNSSVSSVSQSVPFPRPFQVARPQRSQESVQSLAVLH